MNEFTFQQVKSWIGSDSDRADLIDMIKDIANGIYRAEQLHEDVRSWIEEMEEA